MNVKKINKGDTLAAILSRLQDYQKNEDSALGMEIGSEFNANVNPYLNDDNDNDNNSNNEIIDIYGSSTNNSTTENQSNEEQTQSNIQTDHLADDNTMLGHSSDNNSYDASSPMTPEYSSPHTPNTNSQY